jgi:hypothetical protein
MTCDPDKEDDRQAQVKLDTESAELLGRISQALKVLTVDELRQLVAEIESMATPN